MIEMHYIYPCMINNSKISYTPIFHLSYLFFRPATPRLGMLMHKILAILILYLSHLIGCVADPDPRKFGSGNDPTPDKYGDGYDHCGLWEQKKGKIRIRIRNWMKKAGSNLYLI